MNTVFEFLNLMQLSNMQQQLPSWEVYLGGMAVESFAVIRRCHTGSDIFERLLPKKHPITGALQKKAEGHWTLLLNSTCLQELCLVQQLCEHFV